MNSDRIFLAVAVVTAVVAIVAAGFTYYSIASFKETWITGFATDVGSANLTVETNAVVNFTIETINWGSGLVNDGVDNATLDTSTNTTTGGNWTVQGTPLTLENIGNVNVSLNLTGGSSAAAFLGGTSPIYKWNVTEGESGSCYNQTYTNSPSVWYDITGGTEVAWCYPFDFLDNRDVLNIDLQLVVPSDSRTGALGDTITATFSAV